MGENDSIRSERLGFGHLGAGLRGPGTLHGPMAPGPQRPAAQNLSFPVQTGGLDPRLASASPGLEVPGGQVRDHQPPAGIGPVAQKVIPIPDAGRDQGASGV